MARPRGRRRGGGASQARRAPRAASERTDASVADTYAELLVDALSSPTSTGDGERPIKKRRVGGRIVVQGAEHLDTHLNGPELSSRHTSIVNGALPTHQTAYDDSESSDGSDLEWEDVDLGNAADMALKSESSSEPAELDIVLGKSGEATKQPVQYRRKPPTAEDRRSRANVHKLSILCLLSHVQLRNHWCNDPMTQATLKKFLSAKVESYLTDDEGASQFQRNRSLHDGLRQASDEFRGKFKVTSRGLLRSSWAPDPQALTNSEIPEDIDLPMQKSDFRNHAVELTGSRDVGAQLFCTLLRSIGVETRLVCSLQPLPFANTTKNTTPAKIPPTLPATNAQTIVPVAFGKSNQTALHDSSIGIMDNDDEAWKVSRIKSKLDMRLGRSRQSAPRISPKAPASMHFRPKKQRVRESQYPVYWIEAFNTSHQKWVPVDPLVTDTVGKPLKLEPPANDSQNNMSYVVAFEVDGSARDVTRRYTKAYNAKTRKSRLESLSEGEKWWKRTMRLYSRRFELDRDQVEDAEMATKEAQEPMPTNVQDFKNHPYYALERHLRGNEVIHPKKETGKVTTGQGGLSSDKAVEPIYRRRDVHVVKSAGSWYRLGREIRLGEQPLKRQQPRKRARALPDEDESAEEEGAGTGMYAGFQTCLYQAPPVVGGQIPRNQYGNLDVYVPSMVPTGASHIAHSDAAKAARILGVDYADAVTGFEFRGRHGTAVIKGAVVAEEYQEAVIEIIRGFQYQREEAEDMQRTMNALRMWKRLYTGLKIRERIEGYTIEGEEAAGVMRGLGIQDQEFDPIDDDGEFDQHGGFLHDRSEQPIAHPTGGEFAPVIPVYTNPAHQSYLEPGAIDEEGVACECSKEQKDLNFSHTIAGVEKSAEDLLVGPEEDYESGLYEGGFMVEEEDVKLEMRAQSVSDTAISQKQTMPQFDKAGSKGPANTTFPNNSPRTPVRELVEAQLQQQFFESDQRRESSNQQQATEGLHAPEHATAQSTKNPRIADDISVKDSEPFTDAVEGYAVHLHSEQSDKGSLLSSDPEDEDADPDWLV